MTRSVGPRVACEHCDGSGQRELHYTESVTLAAIKYDEWQTVEQIRKRLHLNVKQSALCNRLVTLRKLGLIERRESRTNHRVLEWRRIS